MSASPPFTALSRNLTLGVDSNVNYTIQSRVHIPAPPHPAYISTVEQSFCACVRTGLIFSLLLKKCLSKDDLALTRGGVALTSLEHHCCV